MNREEKTREMYRRIGLPWRIAEDSEQVFAGMIFIKDGGDTNG